MLAVSMLFFLVDLHLYYVKSLNRDTALEIIIHELFLTIACFIILNMRILFIFFPKLQLFRLNGSTPKESNLLRYN